MRLPQRATAYEGDPIAAILRPREALDYQAQRATAVFPLDGVRDKPPGRRHTRHGAGAILQAGGHAGNLGKGSARGTLHDPEVGADLLNQERGFANQPAIDAPHAHHNHQQQADAHSGEGEARQVVANVADGKVHLGSAECGLRSADFMVHRPACLSWGRSRSRAGRQPVPVSGSPV